MATRMLQRRGTAAEWAAQNPILGDGEMGYETDTKVFKIGDGVTAWNALVAGFVYRSLFAAKGDLVASSAANTPVRVPVGSDGAALIADSTQAAGVGWSNLFKPATAALSALRVKGLVGQAGALQTWETSAATASFIDAVGGAQFPTLGIGSAPVGGTQATIKAATSGTIPLLIEGTTGQSNSLIQAWTTGSGPTVFTVGPNGQITTSQGVTATGSVVAGGFYNNGTEALVTGYGGSTQRARFTDDGTHFFIQADHAIQFTKPYTSAMRVQINTDPAINAVPLSIAGVTGQTGHLTDWQNGSGTPVAVVDKDGGVNTPTLYVIPALGVADSAARFYTFGGTMRGALVAPGTAGGWCTSAAVGDMVLRAEAGHIWHANSAGTPLVQFHSNGSIILPTSGSSFKSGNSTFAGVQTTNQFFTGSVFGDSVILHTGTLLVGDGTNFKPIKASAFTVSSAREMKTNVQPITESMDIVRRLRPVRYAYKNEPWKSRAGFIADEVAGIFPEAVSYDSNDEPDGIHYGEFVPLFASALQGFDDRLAAVERQLAA